MKLLGHWFDPVRNLLAEELLEVSVRHLRIGAPKAAVLVAQDI